MRAALRRVSSVMALAASVTGACVACNLAPESGAPTPSGPAPIDISLLTGKPCEPPCWQGLVPELSTEIDVNTFLETSKFVDHESISRGDISTGSGDVIGIRVQWRSSASDHGAQGANSFDIEGGVLRSIETYLDFEVTLEELLERYGPPTRLRARFAEIQRVDAEVTLYYPELGLIARLYIEPSDEQFELQPGCAIQRVWYFSPQPLEDLCDLSGAIPFPDKPEHIDTVLQCWQGYGLIDLR
jgi:hypothetical protein